MLNIEICPCEECKISKWCIREQVKFQDHDQRNPVNWCTVLEQYRRHYNIENDQAGLDSTVTRGRKSGDFCLANYLL